MKQIVECVPNYSEGRDKSVIDNIVAAIASVEGVKVLDVDPGVATNRTVVTFVGEPGPVCEEGQENLEGPADAQVVVDDQDFSASAAVFCGQICHGEAKITKKNRNFER